MRMLGLAMLAAILAVAVAALAGVGAADTGHGKRGVTASAAEYQYGGPAGNQYGLHRMPVCHNGHTLYLPAPAVQAHVRHGDVAAVCSTSSTTHPGHSGSAPGQSSNAGAAAATHGNGNANGHR